MTEFKSRWTGVSLERPRMLMEIFAEHNVRMKALIGDEFSHHTYERYNTSRLKTVYNITLCKSWAEYLSSAVDH